MATHIVTAPVIVVHATDGSQQYVYEGAELPDFVKAATVKELKDAGLVATARQARVTAPKEDPRTPSTPSTPFNPGDHNQDEVLAYLADADDVEVERVKAAEAEGKKRDKVAAFGTGD